MTYADVREWLNDCRNVVSDDWDNLGLYTGEEGTGKSTLMRQVCKAVDPTFTVERIHFHQGAFLDQAVDLPEGSAIQLDEFRGHRRAAMHGDRLEFLDFLKECRGLNLHMAIGFPHVQQIDRDILRSRIRWWVHLPQRGQYVIRKRQATVVVKRGGEPEVNVRWPIVGRFTFQDNDPMRPAYMARKKARMRDRAAHQHGDQPAKAALLDWQQADAVLRDLKLRLA